MRFLAIVLALIVASYGGIAICQEEETTEGTAEEYSPETILPEEEKWNKETEAVERGEVPEKPEVVAGEAEPKPPPTLKLTIDAVVVVGYTFFNSDDAFQLKYHINMGGDIKQNMAVLKGNAKVATDISGYLAKWPTGECLLKVSIADVPYEIRFKKTSDAEADIDVEFKRQITEDWESLCTFIDAPEAKFNTRGMPEKWIGSALAKTDPPLDKLTAKLDPEEEESTLKFSIAKYTIAEENLGFAEVEGTGVVTIKPQVAEKE